jgi:hypothetical protein
MKERPVMYLVLGQSRSGDVWRFGTLVQFVNFASSTGQGTVEGIVIDRESRDFHSVPIHQLKEPL